MKTVPWPGCKHKKSSGDSVIFWLIPWGCFFMPCSTLRIARALVSGFRRRLVKIRSWEAVRGFRLSEAGIPGGPAENFCLMSKTEIVKRSDQSRHKFVLPVRWIVARTMPNRCRRLAKDWKTLERGPSDVTPTMFVR